jgi:hypothetical protein
VEPGGNSRFGGVPDGTEIHGPGERARGRGQGASRGCAPALY